MGITPYLSLPETSRTQVQWDQSINDAFASLERATQDVKVIDFSGGDVALTATDQNRYFNFDCINVTAARVFTLESSITILQPAKRFVSVSSDAANTADIAVKISGNAATLLTLTPGSSVLLHINGTAVNILGSYGVTSTSPSLTYDVSVFISGLPPANKEVYRQAITQNLTMQINFGGSRASARINPTAATTFTIQKNGTTVGTVQFNVSGTHVFNAAAVSLWAPGDVLTILSPAQDATLEDVSITLFATKV